MSKELTQGLAGKRIAWLMAILAAVMLFATVVQTAKPAFAVLSAGTITASPSGGTVPISTVVTFTAVVPFSGAIETLAPITMTLLPAGHYGPFTNVSCVVTTGTLGGTVTLNGTVPGTCTVTSTVAGVPGTITFVATATIITGGTAFPGAALSLPTAVPSSASFTVLDTLTKVVAPTTLTSAGGAATSTITFNHVSSTVAATDAPVVITDSITTAGLTIPAGTPVQGGTFAGTLTACASAAPTGWPGGAIITTATTTLSCTTSAVVPAGLMVIMPIAMTVPINVTTLPIVYSDTASTGAVTTSTFTTTPLPTAIQTITETGVAAAVKLLVLLPGEGITPGTCVKTGTPTGQVTGTAFVITVNSVDAFCNTVTTGSTSTNVVSITSSDTTATLPPAAALVAGTKTFAVIFNTVGAARTVSALDTTTAFIGTSSAITVTAAASVPGAPTSVVAVAGDAQATVTFVTPVNTGGSTITGYTVTGGGTDTQAGTTALSHLITGLTNGTSYTFSVTATNAIGPGPAGISNTVTPSVTAPTNLVILSGGLVCFNFDGQTTTLANFFSGTTLFASGVDGVNIQQPNGSYLSAFRLSVATATATKIVPGDRLCVGGTAGSKVFS